MTWRHGCIASGSYHINELQTINRPYAAVQFGSGDFFESNANITLEAKGSAAFLCSIHLENPAERIRILEFCDTKDAFHILQKIVRSSVSMKISA